MRGFNSAHSGPASRTTVLSSSASGFPVRRPVTAAAPGGRGGVGGVRRYHPIVSGVAHSYQVSFRFGQNESFRDVTRDAWRWAWNTLKPPVLYIDVEQMRRVLIDHLESTSMTIDGRTGMPFVLNTMQEMTQWNRT